MERPRRRRWIWILAAALVVGVVAAAAAVPLLLDVERYRGRIESALAGATGWNAELGSLGVSVWRGLALTVRPARLVAPDSTSEIAVETIEIRAEILPLLRGRLHVRSIDLIQPEILLVRPSRRAGWILPRPGGRAPAPSAPAAPEGGEGFAVRIAGVRVEGGRLTLDDRAGTPPWKVELGDLELAVSPDRGEVEGSGRLGSGSLRWQGNIARGLDVRIEKLPTESLHPFLGTTLLHGGGTLSGEVAVALPPQIRGKLTGRSITLLAGEKPFDELTGEFEVHGQGGRWLLDRLDVDAGGLRLNGRGSLVPVLGLALELPATDLDAALAVAPSVLPLPLDLRGPGEVGARLHVDQPAGGTLSFTAEGELSAARFVVDPLLPPAENVRATFALSRAGALEVRLAEGTVGGGPAKGIARLSSIDPPGTLTFEGSLENAALGALLQGFVGHAERITGPTGLEARLGIDLGRQPIDARALSGRLDLDSRDVRLPGWDLETAIRRKAEEKLGGLGAIAAQAKPADPSDTDAHLLDSVVASVDFDRYPWQLERMALDSRALTASGKGTFDPLAGTVDVDLVARLSPERTASLLRRAAELRYLVDGDGRLTLPLRVRGALTAPSIDVDLRKALGARLGGEKAEDAVKQLLEGFLERKKKPGE